MDLLEEQIQYKYTMAFHENKIKENQPEIKEIKNIGKKEIILKILMKIV